MPILVPSIFPRDADFAVQHDGLLTVTEVARELRCSRAHVHNLINGRVSGVKPLPAIPLGRRRIVRRESLNEWIATNERSLA